MIEPFTTDEIFTDKTLLRILTQRMDARGADFTGKRRVIKFGLGEYLKGQKYDRDSQVQPKQLKDPKDLMPLLLHLRRTNEICFFK